MSEGELNPLSQRLAKWVDNDSIPDAINVLRVLTFEKLKSEYPDGVSDSVMVRLLLAGQQAQIDFLRDMAIDANSAAKDWSERETGEQQMLSVLMLEFMREEAKWETLEQMQHNRDG